MRQRGRGRQRRRGGAKGRRQRGGVAGLRRQEDLGVAPRGQRAAAAKPRPRGSAEADGGAHGGSVRHREAGAPPRRARSEVAPTVAGELGDHGHYLVLQTPSLRQAAPRHAGAGGANGVPGVHVGLRRRRPGCYSWRGSCSSGRGTAEAGSPVRRGGARSHRGGQGVGRAQRPHGRQRPRRRHGPLEHAGHGLGKAGAVPRRRADVSHRHRR
mmetsp:Transcript_43751/g.118038  ORF Transcript_43751/g.118038 Transcript_43751/m.118038 type:complete len:212 (-) Transcript_43751:1145-1780(-)